MSDIKLSWIGLDELKAFLRNLPVELTEVAVAIVSEAADSAAAEIKAAYPEGDTGNLRRGVRVASKSFRFGVYRQVRSTAPHAYIFETGTQVRQNKQQQNRGFMPGANIFVPVVQRKRREMYDDLALIIAERGLSVRR
jgi:Bacteriophage HK97-gp10, putative tail-component